MPYQLPQAQTLDSIFQMNPAAFNQGQQMIQGGMQQNDADLKKAQLANLFDEQNDPLRVQHQQKLNDQLDANLPGLQAVSQQQQLKAQRDAAGQNDAIELARKKFLKDASDSDIEMLGNEAQKMAYSNDPQTRAHGLSILRMSKDMVKEREKQAAESARQVTGIRATGDEQRKTQQQAIDAGKYTKAGKGEGSIEEKIANGRYNYEKASVAYRVLADNTEDQEQAAKYALRADQYEVAAQKQKQAAGQGVPRADMPALGIQTTGGAPQGPSFAPPGASDKKPVTEAEYNSLPAGAMYLHPDGKMKRKK